MDEDFRQKLIKYVKEGDMPPLEAEKIARQAGLEPFRMQQVESETVSVFDGYWPIGFAILWVSWRDENLIAEQWERFRVFGKFLWNDPQDEKQLMSLGAAEEEVWRALRSGKIPSNGMVYPTPVVSEIPKLEWLNLEWTPDHHRWAIRYRHQADRRYSDVKLGSQEVLNLWPIAPVEAAEPTSVEAGDLKIEQMIVKAGKDPRQPKKMGAPSKYDWPRAAGFLVGYLVENDYPELEKELVETLSAWFRQEGQTPDRRDLERFIAEAYKARRIPREK